MDSEGDRMINLAWGTDQLDPLKPSILLAVTKS
jgi:hypothetical protein